MKRFKVTKNLSSNHAESGKGQIPTRIQLALRWFFQTARALLALVLLFSSLTLLHFSGMASQLATKPNSSALHVQLKYDTDLEIFRFSARASKSQTIEAGFQDRVLTTETVPENGMIESWIRVPRQVNTLWFRSYAALDSKPNAEQIVENVWDNLHPFPPTLDVAIFIPEENLVWVAGQLTPGESGVLETVDGNVLFDIVPDSQGIFDTVIRLTGTRFEKDPPTSLQVRLTHLQNNTTLQSSAETLQRISIASLPLRRKMELNFNTGHPSIRLNVELPRNHPYFRSMTEGLLSPDKLMEYLLGVYSGYGVTLTTTWQLEPNIGVLQMVGSWRGPRSNFWFYANNYGGLGTIPYQRGKEGVEAHFEGVNLAWVGSLQTVDQIDAQTITWLPPSDNLLDNKFEIKLKLPEGVKSIDARQEDQAQIANQGTEVREVIKFRDFLAGFEYKSVNELVRQALQAGELLIPFGLVFWYARKRRLGKAIIWNPLAALALILGALSTWTTFQSFLADNLGNWLARASLQFIHEIRLLNQPTLTQIRDASHGAFFVLLVVLISQAPFYLMAVEYRLDNPPLMHWSKRSWFRTFTTIIGLILVVCQS